MKKKSLSWLALLLPLFFLVNCNETNNTTDGTLSFYLKDAPSDELKSVFVNIDSIQILYSIDGEDKKYVIENQNSQLVDLMQLRDGIAMKLQDIPFSDGVKINRLRLVLNPEDNYAVRLDDSICELKTPSAQKSGLKIHLSEGVALEAGSNYSLVFDFDVDRSVVINPQKCLLKPVLKVEALFKDENPEDDAPVVVEEPVSEEPNSDENDTGGDEEVDTPVVDEPNFDQENEETIVDIVDIPGDEVIIDEGGQTEEEAPSDFELDLPVSDEGLI